ncbi:hypothetical protein CK203_105593 [Vitis vinifera]|uniref:Uncharacterized protein n=1 Tax=Vitis vinifera TaxID=29760 RepID=A0A438CI41_VITVI|nr:hypothetical protein CK203_105593 [Vitis vinifera]
MINLYGGKYYVADINYQNYSIRVVDPGLKKGNCLISSPLHSIGAYYRMNGFRSYCLLHGKLFHGSGSGPIFYTILSMNCEQSISDHNYIPIIPCNTTGYSSSSSPNILLCNSRRIRVRGRYAVFLHHQHIHGYSTVEGTSRVQQSFHVRFARLPASGASAFIFASLLQQPTQNERANLQLYSYG